MEAPPSIIAEFLSRSQRLRYGAYAILVAILCLIGAGIYVFRTAQQITSGDLNGNVSKTLETNKAALSKLQTENENIVKRRSQAVDLLRPEVARLFSKYSRQETGNNEIAIRFDQTPVYSITGAYIADMIRKVVDAQKSDTFTAWVVFYNQIGFFTLSKLQWLEIAAAASTEKFDIPYEILKENDAKAVENSKQINFLFSVDNVLEGRLVNIAAGIDPGLGDGVSENKSDPLFRLLQTNFTRFGTLAVITFLITIFIPLYRYNMRLSAFYLARSDALRLSGKNIGEMNFEGLVAALSPNIDFGKIPQTPVEQLINFVRATSRAEKD